MLGSTHTPGDYGNDQRFSRLPPRLPSFNMTRTSQSRAPHVRLTDRPRTPISSYLPAYRYHHYELRPEPLLPRVHHPYGGLHAIPSSSYPYRPCNNTRSSFNPNREYDYRGTIHVSNYRPSHLQPSEGIHLQPDRQGSSTPSSDAHTESRSTPSPVSLVPVWRWREEDPRSSHVPRYRNEGANLGDSNPALEEGLSHQDDQDEEVDVSIDDNLGMHTGTFGQGTLRRPNRAYYPLLIHQRQFDHISRYNGQFLSTRLVSDSVSLTAWVFAEAGIVQRESLGLNSLTDGQPAGPTHRPPHTIAEIIRGAILGSPCHKLTLEELRIAIRARFVYYANLENDAWLVSSSFLMAFFCEIVAN
jgi:hypothetical protein